MVKVIHEKCDPKLREDRKLPYTAYLIEYVDKENGKIKSSMISHYVRNKQRCLISTMISTKQV